MEKSCAARLCGESLSQCLTQLIYAFPAAETTLFKFVVLIGFNKTSTSSIVGAPSGSSSGKEHGAVPALRDSWARVAHF